MIFDVIENNRTNPLYQIIGIRLGGKVMEAFTSDGKYDADDTEQNVFHLEDINKSEFPKWMMVSGCPITEKNKGDKRYVLAKHFDKICTCLFFCNLLF